MPEVATAGRLSSGLCVQSLSRVDAAVLLVVIALGYIFRVWSIFRQVACSIGGVTHGACFDSS